MGLLGWVRAWQHARRRRLDLKTLWPAIVDRSRTLDEARACFAIHAYNSPAWLALAPVELTRTLHDLQEPDMSRGSLVVISGEKLLAREKIHGA